MKIIVPIKRVIDANVHIRVKKDSSGVETEGVKMAINPFCEIALEEALRLRESGKADEVAVLTIGERHSVEVLRTGLAMGADRAIHVETDAALQPLGVARIIKDVVDREKPDLVLLGKLAIDDEHNQTGQMLAGLLNWAQGTFVSVVEIGEDSVEVTREVDSGLEVLSLSLPAVITADLRLNEPRYIRLPDFMKAKKKSIERFDPSQWDIDLETGIEFVKMEEPPRRLPGIKVSSVTELVDKLRNEAKVI